MPEDMSIDDYLAAGGRLTSPDNVPPRYRAELLRLMATFVDSALAGAAGFAERINDGPGVRARIAAARIVLEKMRNAERVLALMGEFGADTQAYVTHQPWNDRLVREADIGAARHGRDMRLNVFHYPLTGWTDAVAMNVLMGQAVVVQLEEFARVSYQPLAEAFRAIAPVEARHAELGVAGLRQLVAGDGGAGAAAVSLGYWTPRVLASFGQSGSARFDALAAMGLRHERNEALAERWRQRVTDLRGELGI